MKDYEKKFNHYPRDWAENWIIGSAPPIECPNCNSASTFVARRTDALLKACKWEFVDAKAGIARSLPLVMEYFTRPSKDMLAAFPWMESREKRDK